MEENIIKDPFYYILNLCKILQYLEIKKEDREWALKFPQKKEQRLVKKALSFYCENQSELDWRGENLVNFAKGMIGKIRTKLKESI